MQVSTSLQSDNHASTPPQFLQAGCPSCHPTNSVKALKAYAVPLPYLFTDNFTLTFYVHQRLEVELREEMSRLKSERLVKETQISRLEMSMSEKADQITELQRQLRQVLVLAGF